MRAVQPAALVLVAWLAGTLAAAPAATAWSTDGHRLASTRAVRALPREFPLFFRRGADVVAGASVDPDLLRSRQLPQLRDAESPEHYIDLELLGGRSLPETRYRYVDLVTGLGAAPRTGPRWGPSQIGLLPYAVVESTQRLAMALAEHRRWPRDSAIRAKVLVYAGLLAHYAEDLCQPLHTTIHHNGRAEPDGSSPGTGIHALTDALFGGLEPAVVSSAAEGEPAVLEDLFADVEDQVRRSHELVERVYELEPLMRAVEGGDSQGGPLAEFARDRFRETVRFTASLFVTAWELSASLELPAWRTGERPLHRPQGAPASGAAGQGPPAQLPR